jgi:hypothetical protein
MISRTAMGGDVSGAQSAVNADDPLRVRVQVR